MTTEFPKFQPLTGTQREELISALRGNVNWGQALLTDRRDTSFAGVGDVTDDEVICAIRSVSCHYAL